MVIHQENYEERLQKLFQKMMMEMTKIWRGSPICVKSFEAGKGGLVVPNLKKTLVIFQKVRKLPLKHFQTSPAEHDLIKKLESENIVKNIHEKQFA